MSCPFMNRKSDNGNSASMRVNLSTMIKGQEAGMLYGDYLQLDKLLSSQTPVTRKEFTSHRRTEVHDEHLFIITHQTYELWFKQIIFELDSVRDLLNNEQVDEANMLRISSRLDRIRKIFGILVEQFSILETMTPLDFMDFRDYLAPASGFQSYQFRLIENKLGIKNENRFNYKPNQENQPYLEVFRDPECIESIKKSEREPSLFTLIERWLERTPGLEKDGFNFLEKYRGAVDNMLKPDLDYVEKLRQKINTEKLTDTEKGELNEALRMAIEEVQKKKLSYEPILGQDDNPDESSEGSVRPGGTAIIKGRQAGGFRFSRKAMQGALMISLYRDEPRFNQPYQLLCTLMDIDSLLTKWRQNHTQMVLRMIGSDTLGTGGSSGFQYLRATLSPRYNVFLDLYNLSTYMIQREYIPELTPIMKKRLSTEI